MKRSPSITLLAWLGLLAALAASTSFAPAQAAGRPAGAVAPVAPAARAPAAPAGEEVTAMIAGAAHTCALFAGRTMRCWGDNQYGELGNGATAPSPRPVEVKGLPGAPAATLTRAVHNCSLFGDGTVQCWGMNKYGQLGDGTLTNSSRPIPVKGLTGKVRMLTVGGDHVCVTYENDSTWCWGQNKYGELGNGRLSTGSKVPVEVKGLSSPPVRLASGVWNTCAVVEDGSTWCWGHNEEGELGNGTKSLGSATPVKVKGLPSTPVKLTAGNFHTCALVRDGSTWCWGEGKYGQLGTGSTKFAPAPKPVVGLQRGPTQLVAGGYHTCAVFGDNTMWCWGQNNFGQLGNGTTANASKPVQVRNFRINPKLVVAGGLHTCVAYRDNSIDCWGLNAAGQLGNGTTKPLNPTPGSVVGLAAAPAHHGAHQAASTSAGDDDSDDGISTGKMAGIGLPALAVVVFVGFLVTRRRPN